MNQRAVGKGGPGVAALWAAAVVLAGCAGGGGSSAGDPDGEITLTLATFDDFGYTDELLQEYMDENPDVTIVHTKAAESGDARADYLRKLGKEGLADIEAVDLDWFADAMPYSDLLAEVPGSAEGRWLDWKEAGATDADGRLVGFGTDIGPQAICYRADLFEAAGLPSGPDEVASVFEGDWDHFLDVADQYREATGKPMIDSANSVLQGIVDQIEYTYVEPDGTVIATTNPEIEAAYSLVVDRAVPNAAYAGQGGDDWKASMTDGAFAAVLCPVWMLGVISGNARDVTGWDVANVFPGGGGNRGGSYLTVPANGAQVDAALALADWLTAPEQQVKAFVEAGTFPSQFEALGDPALTEWVNPFFNDAPTGIIFAERAGAVSVVPYRSAHHFTYHQALEDAVIRVFEGVEDTTTSWNTWLAEIEGF